MSTLTDNIDSTLNASRNDAVAATYTPDERQINEEKDLVQGQLKGLLDSNSLYIKRARTKGKQFAQTRGLLNSSMAAGATEAAAIDAAVPIATADAGTYFRQGLENQLARNTAKNTNAQLGTQANIANAGNESAERNQALQVAGTLEATNLNNAAEMERLNISEAGALERTQLQESGAMERLRISEAGLNTRLDITNQAAMDRLDVANQAAMDQLTVSEAGATERSHIAADAAIRSASIRASATAAAASASANATIAAARMREEGATTRNNANIAANAALEAGRIDSSNRTAYATAYVNISNTAAMNQQNIINSGLEGPELQKALDNNAAWAEQAQTNMGPLFGVNTDAEVVPSDITTQSGFTFSGNIDA